MNFYSFSPVLVSFWQRKGSLFQVCFIATRLVLLDNVMYMSVLFEQIIPWLSGKLLVRVNSIWGSPLILKPSSRTCQGWHLHYQEFNCECSLACGRRPLNIFLLCPHLFSVCVGKASWTSAQTLSCLIDFLPPQVPWLLPAAEIWMRTHLWYRYGQTYFGKAPGKPAPSLP